MGDSISDFEKKSHILANNELYLMEAMHGKCDILMNGTWDQGRASLIPQKQLCFSFVILF